MTNVWKNRVFFITGCISGMGMKTAEMAAMKGAKVFATGLDYKILVDLKSRINRSGGICEIKVLDVTEENAWKEAAQECKETYGAIDALANIAGVSTRDAVTAGSREIWDQAMNVNAYGSYLGMKYCIPYMQENGQGAIVNISSVAGVCGVGGGTAYPASKGAVRAMTKRVALQYGVDNIRVNTIIPGWIETQMTANARQEKREQFLERQCLKTSGQAEDIANAVLFLLSDEAKFITGAELCVDGGFLAS